MLSSKICHPERSEVPAVRRKKQVLRFAQDDNIVYDNVLMTLR
jgi:hypothetical protein